MKDLRDLKDQGGGRGPRCQVTTAPRIYRALHGHAAFGHPGDNIRANGTSQKWTRQGMPPDSGGILRGGVHFGEVPFDLMLSPGLVTLGSWAASAPV